MISEQLASFERRSPAQPVHILPAHQQLIAPLPTGYVGPAMQAGEGWLRRFGYRPLGPWLISWGSSGQPHLRRPVSGALRAVEEGGFRTVELPGLLMLAVPFQGWPVLPHDLLPFVRRQGFEAIGQPLLLAIGNEPPTVAWVPVSPRGTLPLVRTITATGIARKIGLLPPAPEPGQRLGLPAVLRYSWLASLHALVALAIAGLLLLNCSGLAEYAIFFSLLDSPFWTVLNIGRYIAVIFAVFFVFNLLRYWLAVNRWNTFWRGRPAPPTLAIYSGLGSAEAQAPAWFGSGA